MTIVWRNEEEFEGFSGIRVGSLPFRNSRVNVEFMTEG